MNECIDTILKKADDCYLKKDYLGAAKNIEEAVASNPDSAELWATWGNVEFQSRNLPEAIVKYREACRLQPQSPDYWTYLAIALLQDGNIEEFESSLESALNIDPFHLDSLKLLGDLCFRNDKKTEAAHSYYKILQKNPDDIEVLMRIGSCLYEGGEVEVAMECYERVLKLDPKNDMALDNLSTCNSKLKQESGNGNTEGKTESRDDEQHELHNLLEDAEFFNSAGNTDSTAETLEQAVNLAPNDAIIVSALGSVYFKLGKYEKAREMFRKEIELNPRDADAYTRLSMAALFCERVDEFESSIGIAVEINPNHLEALRFLGKINLQTGRYLDAAKIFAKLIELNPKFPEFYLALGYSFHKGGEKETAKDVFERVLEFDPENECAINNLRYISNPEGETVLSHTIQNEEEVVKCDDLAEQLVDFELAYWDKEKNEAKSVLNKIFDATPENYEVLAALSTLFFQLCEFETAKNLINKAIKLDGSAPEGWTQLALCELNLQNLPSSIQAIDKSLERHPSPEARKLKGKILYLTEDYKQAQMEFEQLSKDNPEDLYLMQCDAICRHKLGDDDSAMRTYERILELDPDNEIAKNNINAISASKPNQLQKHGEISDLDSILTRADKLYKDGDLHAAILEIENILNGEEDNPILYATLGSLEFQSGLTEKAVKHLRKAVEVSGDSADFLTRLALAEHKAGNTPSFIENLDMALRCDPAYVPALKLRGDFNLGASKFKPAATDYISIIKAEPENIEAILALGVCFHKTNDQEAAVTTFERVLTIDPENSLAKENLAAVQKNT
ncbi:MAG: tetratricopeptide repeat protein [Verrucomicrobiota bacterium]|jgi:tetratricopeptide (TPR) repeat protein|nr:tetratricopeptide repeat protein [Verrucomicrobiota bacterium]